MEVRIVVSEEEFPPAQQQIVREALGIASGQGIQAYVTKLSKAALLEYLNMFVEKGMPSRADEVRQNRLYFLIKHYYQDHLPSESEISLVFQLTESQSRGLLRNTRSRYRPRISSQVHSSAKSVVQKAKLNEDSEKWEMLIGSEVILEELNVIISRKGPTLKPVQLKRNCSGLYEAEEDTYKLLKTELGIE